MPNRLAGAVSPYLRSHAANPVDWWEWGADAFEEARRRDVPVLVSIGYATCHWCHVMARESFSDPDVAAFMNENLVAIKVDREEYPDVDASYLAAAGAFTQDLGWPLNVFVTPQGRTFFAGTYWPPVPAHGRASFRQVLGAVLEAWTDRRTEVEGSAAAIADALAGQAAATPSPLPNDFSPIVSRLATLEDTEFGGFSGAPKFPVTPAVLFLLERGSAGDATAGALAARTLDAMAASAVRDPVEDGFFRYATRRDWSDPHYERMLYDNAQLLAAYAKLGRREVAEGIATFLIERMQQPSGGFASAQDSESTIDGERVEGFYYSLDAASRSRVAAPPLDEKVITGWNGLAIEGLAIAGTLLDRPDWIAAARRAADYLVQSHVLEERLVRVSIDGVVSAAKATLEDYGMLASGLLHLATATGEARYANVARRLVDDVLAAGGVPGGADPVLAASGLALAAEPSDGAHPSGPSAFAGALHRLYLLTGHAPYLAEAEARVASVAAIAVEQPVSFGAALAVMSRLGSPVAQLVIVGGAGPLVEVARRWDGSLSAVVTPEQAVAFAGAGFELFEGRTEKGGPTAYLCEDFVCRLPITDPEKLAEALLVVGDSE
ncbi:MAG: thioredoxin domain-containing protein [Rhodoglobus sp.]